MRLNIAAMENYRNNTGALSLTNQSSGLLEKACCTVDNCLQLIEEQVARYMGEKMREAPAFVTKALFENISPEKNFHHLMISDFDVLHLQQKIITVLDEELTANGYFVALKPQPVEINTQILHEVTVLSRGVVKTSALAAAVGGWAAEMIAGGAVEEIPGGDIIESLCGGFFQRAFITAHHEEEAACARRLLLSVTGLLQGIGHQIREQLSAQAAAAVYSYGDKDFDPGIGRECDKAVLPA